MDFGLSPEEREFEERVRSVLEKAIRPEYAAWAERDTTPPRMFELLAENGLLGFRAGRSGPEPIPWLQNIHFYRQAGAFSGGLAIAAFAHAQLGMQALYDSGPAAPHAPALEQALRGRAILAFANTEPGAGSDAAAISLRAEETGEGYVIRGTKSYITNGDIADQIVFTAVTAPDAARPHQGISMFRVDGRAAGLERHRLRKRGWSPSHLSVLTFRDVAIPRENRVGDPGTGFYRTMEVFNASRIGIAALACGTARGALEMARKHAARRKTFGKTLLEHESKRNELADRVTGLQAAWLLTQKAAFLRDAGGPFRHQASMAKLFAAEQAMETARWAAELFGARGVLETHPVSAYPEDARLAMIGEGAPEVQKKIIAEGVDPILAGL